MNKQNHECITKITKDKLQEKYGLEFIVELAFFLLESELNNKEIKFKSNKVIYKIMSNKATIIINDNIIIDVLWKKIIYSLSIKDSVESTIINLRFKYTYEYLVSSLLFTFDSSYIPQFDKNTTEYKIYKHIFLLLKELYKEISPIEFIYTPEKKIELLNKFNNFIDNAIIRKIEEG